MRIELDGDRVVVVADTHDAELHLRALAARRCIVLITEDFRRGATAANQSPPSIPSRPRASAE